MIILWTVLYLEVCNACLFWRNYRRYDWIRWIGSLLKHIGWCFLWLRRFLFLRWTRCLLCFDFWWRGGRFHMNRRHWMWRRRWCCLSTLWLWFGTLGSFPLDLARLGGIGTCLSTSGYCRFASLLIQQQMFHECKCNRVLMKFCWIVKVTDEVPRAADVSWKDCVSMERNRYRLRKSKAYLESLCQSSNGNRWRRLGPLGGYLLETHISVH